MARAPVVALLGPTNTGKTYHAIERMLTFKTGMIGFPLRLLARENYERLVAAKGLEAVALVTGEEQVVPAAPAYFACTVEAMPLDRRVDFLAVDEIQMAADRERGHIFTDRLLHSRGLEETMFLGAETIRPLLRALVPEAECLARPRLSTLSYVEPKKLTRLPPRTAVLGFSVAAVYALAERMRHEKGGAALVFGALSPRTRNAQVGLYQGGEVDYLVATDAIGMGLNLDIDHVVFTALAKHDGQGQRPLTPAEVGQIAGRAGRHVRDGTFGATDELGPFAPALVEAVEHHRFRPLERVYWRSSELDFSSAAGLLRSLERRPPCPQLVRMKAADDHRALSLLLGDPEIAGLARHGEEVRLLWEVCRIPDFRNVLSEAHTRLQAEVFRSLRTGGGLPEDWVAAQVAALDHTDGDIDVMLGRIAHIRTWTYVSHRRHWLPNARHWQERTRAIEDRLSDALHERLTEQFVDRHASVLARHEAGDLVVAIGETGEVLVQGLLAGRLEGFRFTPDERVQHHSRSLLAAANRALRAHVGERVELCATEPDSAFRLGAEGGIEWRGGTVGRVARGDTALSPRIEAIPSDLLQPAQREQIRRRLAGWLAGHIRQAFAALLELQEAGLGAVARGLLFTLAENLGSVDRRKVAEQLGALGRDERRRLGRGGLVLGRFSVYLQQLLRPDVISLRALLFAVRSGVRNQGWPLASSSLAVDASVSREAYAAAGYRVLGPRAVRVDVLERLGHLAERHLAQNAPVGPRLTALLACSPEEALAVLAAIGYVNDAAGRLGRRARSPRRKRV